MNLDQELAARVAVSGDRQAFAQLVERHQQPIRRYLRRLLSGDDATADDLAQETFLTAYQKLHTFKGRSSLSTWLHTVAYRQFLSWHRKRKRTRPMAEVPDQGHDTRPATDAEILARQLLGQVGPEDRACLTLAYSVGMSHAEIAQVVDQPLGTVKARIHRAKLKLNQWLQDNDHSLQTQAKRKANGGEQRHA